MGKSSDINSKIRSLRSILTPRKPGMVSKRFENHLLANKQIWTGPYESWATAAAETSGFDNELILTKCKAALLKVKNGEAVYERDSVLFDEIQYSWGLLAGLQKAALANEGRLCVMDFGGSLGSSYFQNRKFLQTVRELKWCIIEQPNFVTCGQDYFANEQLQFYYTINECLQENKPNVLLLSSVLQYLEKPYDWIEKFLRLQIPFIIVDRTAFVKKENDILTLQNVPEEIYQASYPAWFFGKNFYSHFAEDYLRIAEFDSGFTPPVTLHDGLIGYWSGMILERKDINNP